MKKIRLLNIVGARPQFIKAAVVSQAVKKFNKKRNLFKEMFLHTGQHYDANMSDSFFKELHIPNPKYNLGVRESTHAQQTAKMMVGIEKILNKEKPDIVIIYGDTNTTLAGALAAAKLRIPIAHIEAGLRSFNRNMAEEINRVVTDGLSSFLFCPTQTAAKNLKREGISKNVFTVGDVMYDSMTLFLKTINKKSFSELIADLRIQNKGSKFLSLDLSPKNYYLSTVHRAENTDDPFFLKEIFSALDKLLLPVIVPIHPRTKKTIMRNNISIGDNLYFIFPVSYSEMLTLEKNAKLILTDSGGVQKEAFFLKVPCIILRPQTEWLETLGRGNNAVIRHTSCKNILKAVTQFRNKTSRYSTIRDELFGSGDAGSKIIKVLSSLYKC